ncbi:hypothetical protein [Marinigracilibium pacificum]|uniref:Uncharacterized protein n=1 Tax=Marinigracilibium pacificum TaxID=2729599 RepID=A0A848J058_9BACT|nr:hypothetical protein [Marinigracilibium pacificum]NMM49927.1 hypothetical protein [Marinigracilibium pacificum]
MTQEEVKKSIEKVPIGSRLQIIKKNGSVIDVWLASHEVEGTEKIEYDGLVVPALPPAITVNGSSRFGEFRIDTDEIVKIAWIDR